MQVSAESTDDAIKKLEQIMPKLAAAVAEQLGITARMVAIDNWVVVPYLEKKE